MKMKIFKRFQLAGVSHYVLAKRHLGIASPSIAQSLLAIIAS